MKTFIGKISIFLIVAMWILIGLSFIRIKSGIVMEKLHFPGYEKVILLDNNGTKEPYIISNDEDYYLILLTGKNIVKVKVTKNMYRFHEVGSSCRFSALGTSIGDSHKIRPATGRDFQEGLNSRIVNGIPPVRTKSKFFPGGSNER